MAIQVKLSAEGEVLIPPDVLQRLGLTAGGVLLLEETEEGLVLRTTDQGVERAQAIYRKLVGDRPGMSVDHFLREKHEQTRREAAHDRELYGE